MNNIIDGIEASLFLKNKIKQEINEEGLTPCLTVIQIGDNKASTIYVRNKEKACNDVKIKFDLIKFPETISEDLVIDEIRRLNNDVSVNGILVQLPLQQGFDEGKIINEISPLKDVDGLTYQNVGNLVLENECLVSCTPMGVMELLDMYNASDHAEHATLVCSGNGLRKNDALRNLFGLRFGMQTVTPVHKEEAAYGAALSALTAAGLKDSLSHAQALIQYQK